ncbi:methionyl-tRNA formyltransferase [bacterium]|nr:methionyl-tRNA formyltransferase [bacterium]
MGTPEFAAWNLEYLITNGLQINTVVSQPDRKSGRGQKVIETPVKKIALKYGIDFFQPEDINSEESQSFLKSLKPDIAVVVAYGQLLRRKTLRIPEFGCINLHASLLPEYRGAAPIQRSLVDGKKFTGVTTIKMNLKMDAGKILLRKKVNIAEDETTVTLYEKLKNPGGEILLETVERVLSRSVEFVKQDESLATSCSKIEKEEGIIDFDKMDAQTIFNLWRGLILWPEVSFEFRKKKIKIKELTFINEIHESVSAGTIIEIKDEGIVIKCNSGCLNLKKVQLPGKRSVPGKDFFNGMRLQIGSSLLKTELG